MRISAMMICLRNRGGFAPDRTWPKIYLIAPKAEDLSSNNPQPTRREQRCDGPEMACGDRGRAEAQKTQ